MAQNFAALDANGDGMLSKAELGLPVSPFMARLETAADLALGQVAFIDYVVQPLFAAAQKIFPEVSELEANCRQNREAWRALGARASADRASG